MKRQMKIAAVVSATALLAIGASFTSMAAAKTGTWNLEDEGWVCYDKDGNPYEGQFCLDAGKEYYVGDDGVLVRNEWVDDGTYYVDSTGAKTVNSWKKVVPYDGDEEDDAEWFYFGTAGKKAVKKTIIGNETYYFNEDGVLLTGWVDTSDNTVADSTSSIDSIVYCNEDGARVSSQWINTFAPGTDEEDQEDADTFWYYIKSKGNIQTGKNRDINGETYFFGNDGKMLTGWVLGTDTNDDTKDDSFVEIESSSAFQDGNIYFCGSADQGYVKKNRWINTWAPEDFADADEDVDKYWYRTGKEGVVIAAGKNAKSAHAVSFVNGEAATFDKQFAISTASNAIVTKSVNNKTYAFNEKGQMWSGLVQVDGSDMYYYGASDDGAMKKGSVAIADSDDYEYKFFFGENDKNGYTTGVAVTGQGSSKLYINGILRTADDKYEEVGVTFVNEDNNEETHYFLIDEDGDIRTSKKVYKDSDGNVVLNAEVDNFKFESAKGPKKGSYTK